MTSPHDFFRKKKDSDQLETVKEVLLGVMRTLHQLTEQTAETHKRIDNLTIWITQYFTQQSQLRKSPSSAPPWMPKTKKETITTVVALVVFALAVLAIILGSCGVIGCEIQ